ncbi:MAG: phosphatase PAP2 family protein [Gemmatimonadaceae bacterium]
MFVTEPWRGTHEAETRGDDHSLTMRDSLIFRLDARDRAWFNRLVLGETAPAVSTFLWVAVTHLGGATSAIVAVLVPLLVAHGALRAAAFDGALALLVSHLAVQVIKRRILRERPAPARHGRSLVGIPDRFSFPSGHACAAMSVAFAYGIAFPVFAVPLIVLAVVVGMSRVRLGVHYPGDVLAGQALAVATVLALRMP